MEKFETTESFKEKLRDALQKYDYTRCELSRELDLGDFTISNITSSHTTDISQKTYNKINDWLQRKQNESLAERLLFNVEYQKLKSTGKYTPDQILKMLRGKKRDIVSRKDNAAHFLSHDFSNVDTELAYKVLGAVEIKEKLGYIQDYRTELVADYGETLMDVPDDEPRLLTLQLANRMLE